MGASTTLEPRDTAGRPNQTEQREVNDMDGQPYPFQKNRYFRKKRMRAADFQRDQAFADGKVAFLSHWLFGAGVALGLGVQRVDSDSLLVEPGFAVDPCGRLVVVDEPALRRLRTLEGFRELTGETATLWLRFAEEELEPMFVSGDGGETQEFAAARETFDFFLTDGGPRPASEAERALYSRFLLYEDGEVRVTQCIPKILSGTRSTELRLDVECFSPEPVEAEIAYTPKIPGFAGPDGKDLPEFWRRLRLEKGETSLAVPVRPVSPGQTVSVSLEEGDFLLEKRGQRRGALGAFREEFPVTMGDPAQELSALLTARSPQELWDTGGRGVPVAALRLVRNEDQALLDDVIPLDPGRRASAPWLREELRRVSRRCWPEERRRQAEQAPSERAETKEPQVPERRRTSTGTVVLQAGLHMGEGNILTSDELSHGLGPGAVCVEFGVENVYPVANDDRNRTDLLLGDVSLFEQASGTYDADFDRGVRVHPDKGTFELALRLKGGLRQSSLRLRWFAWRPESGESARSGERTGTLLRLEPDLIRVKPGETVHFTPVFAAGAAAPCDFLTEGRQGGAVTRDGLYTAPERRGLFQVRAQVRGNPEERAEAFVIVGEEEADGPDSV